MRGSAVGGNVRSSTMLMNPRICTRRGYIDKEAGRGRNLSQKLGSKRTKEGPFEMRELL
jgi:hypothetical protein